jgi:hypothetical protein
LRTKWTGLHTNEVFFRDTAHGFLAWAFGTLITFGVLGAAITHIGSGAAAGVSGAATAQAAQNASPADLYVDKLFRPAASPAAGAAVTPGAQPTAGSPDTSRSEVSRLWTSSFSANNDLSAEDRTYVARVVAGRTGLSQQEAEKRVNDVIVEAKAAADKARKAAAQLALWLTASMLFGAFAASLAAVEGGQLRDGTWNGRVLTPRPL